MMKYLAQGWKMTLWNPFLIVLLFLYQFAWGFALYRMVQDVVVPVMHRYPGKDMPVQMNSLFWAESQFQLFKTDLAQPYVWTLLIVLLARMALTPLLNAGIWHQIHQTHVDGKRSFTAGIRRFGAAFAGVYVVRMALMLLPLIWLIPEVESALFSGGIRLEEAAAQLLPVLAAYGLYWAVLDLAAMYVQFGIAGRTGLIQPLGVMVRHALCAVGIRLAVFAALVLALAAGLSVTLFFAGLAAIVAHQAFPLVRVLLNLWEISSQHQLWATKTSL